MPVPFEPRFVDLVRNLSTTQGTGNFVLGAAVAGFTSFSPAVLAGENFYYSAIGIDKPNEREVGRGTMQANGTIAREAVSGPLTSFTSGQKSIALIAAAEWFNAVQAASGTGGDGGVATRAALAAMASQALPVTLLEAGREGLFQWDASNLSARVAADPSQGVYVAPAAAPSGASGAWVRKFTGALIPEWFGAKGDGATNDQAAFDGLNSLTAALGYAEISLRQGAVYRAGGQTQNSGGLYQQGKAIIKAAALAHLILHGNGATIKFVDGLKFGNFNVGSGSPETPALPYFDLSTRADIGWAVTATDTAVVRVSDLILDGNSVAQVIGGVWGDTGTQCAHTGLQLYGCADKLVSGVTIRNFLTDGWIIGETGLTEASDPRPLTMINCTVDSCGRNCGSLVGGNHAVMVNLNHSRSGRAPKAGGGYLGSAPASCLDIEAESATIRNVAVYGGSFAQGPLGLTAFAADSGDSADISFHGTQFVGAVWATKPRMTFNKCRIHGYFAALHGGAIDPNDNCLIDNCSITDATLGDTPLQNAIVGGFVIDTEGAGAGVRIQRTTFDLTRLLLNIRSARTNDVTAIMRHSTTYRANQNAVAFLDGGRHQRLRLVEALTAPLPADAYFTEGNTNASTEMLDCEIVAGGGRLLWTTWSTGGGGYAGKFDNQLLSKKRVALQKNQGSHGEYFGTAALSMHSTMPSAGNYTAGDFVWNEAPALNGIMGWRRLTTGSDHVLNTDWVAVREPATTALSGTNTGDQTITLTGDVTGTGTGSFAATIGANKVTFAKFVAAGAASMVGATAAGNFAELTPASARSVLGLAAIATSGSGADLSASSVTYAKLQNVSAPSLLLGRATAGGGVVEEVSLANGLAMAGSALGLGAITPSSVVTAGAVASSGTAGNGYSAGAGGAVTQSPNKSSAATLNKICGRVTMSNASLAASTSVSFTLTNSTIAATDVVLVNIASGGAANSYFVTVDAVAAGSCRIHLRNISAGALAEAVVLNFAVTKSVIA